MRERSGGRALPSAPCRGRRSPNGAAPILSRRAAVLSLLLHRHLVDLELHATTREALIGGVAAPPALATVFRIAIESHALAIADVGLLVGAEEDVLVGASERSSSRDSRAASRARAAGLSPAQTARDSGRLRTPAVDALSNGTSVSALPAVRRVMLQIHALPGRNSLVLALVRDARRAGALSFPARMAARSDAHVSTVAAVQVVLFCINTGSAAELELTGAGAMPARALAASARLAAGATVVDVLGDVDAGVAAEGGAPCAPTFAAHTRLAGGTAIVRNERAAATSLCEASMKVPLCVAAGDPTPAIDVRRVVGTVVRREGDAGNHEGGGERHECRHATERLSPAVLDARRARALHGQRRLRHGRV
jgi:hypothetical protein